MKSIYEPERMSSAEEELMQKSFVHWSNALHLNEDEKWHLEMMAKMISDNNSGKFERRKMLFKEWNINYKQFHKIPEARFISPEYKKMLNEIKDREKALYG
jgi:hypothetical protein